MLMYLPYIHQAWMWFKAKVLPKLMAAVLALFSCTTVPVFDGTKVVGYYKGIYDDCFEDGGSQCIKCYEYKSEVYCVLIERR